MGNAGGILSSAVNEQDMAQYAHYGDYGEMYNNNYQTVQPGTIVLFSSGASNRCGAEYLNGSGEGG
jgi:hypothetical protein